MGRWTCYICLQISTYSANHQRLLNVVYSGWICFMLRLSYKNFRSLNALEIEILNSDRYPDPSATVLMKSLYKQNDEVVPKIKLPLNCNFKLMIHEKWCSPLPLYKYLEGQFHVMMWQVGQTKLGHPTQRPHILQFPRLSRLVWALWNVESIGAAGLLLPTHRWVIITIRADMNLHDPKIPRCPPKRCKEEKIKAIKSPPNYDLLNPNANITLSYWHFQCHRHPHNSYQLEYILATIRMNEHYVFFSRHFRCNNNGLLQPFIQAASLETLKISGCGPCNSVAVFKSYQPINWCVNNKKWKEHVTNMFNPSIFNPRKTWLLKTWLQKKQLWESEGTSYVLQLSTRNIKFEVDGVDGTDCCHFNFLPPYPGFKVLMPDRSWELPCTAEVLTSWMFVESAFDLQVWSCAKVPFWIAQGQLLLVEPTTRLFGKNQDIRKMIDLIRLEHIVSVFCFWWSFSLAFLLLHFATSFLL